MVFCFKLLLIILLISFPFLNLQAESHHPQEFLSSIKGTKEEGKQIVQHFCASCHAEKPMIELGAPKIEKENDWAPRMQQGIKLLLEHTASGFNAMPARGGCFECSDEQLILAILAMLPEPWRDQFSGKKAHKKTVS